MIVTYDQLAALNIAAAAGILVALMVGFAHKKEKKVPCCEICGKPATKTTGGKRVGDSAYWGYVYYYYHEECIKSVLADPEKYTNTQVDFAIEIGDELTERKRRARKILEAL